MSMWMRYCCYKIRTHLCCDDWHVLTVQDDTFSVPIHAYPIAAGVTFPASIDFGAVAVGARVTRTIPLACTVPVEFEFTISNQRPDSEFTVIPASGVIPALGCINVEIGFQPTAMCTHVTDLVLSLSQYEAAPMTCCVTGCSPSGTMRKSLLKQNLGAEMLDMEELDGLKLLNDALRKSLSRTALGGSGHGDLVTESTWRARKRSLDPMEVCNQQCCRFSRNIS